MLQRQFEGVAITGGQQLSRARTLPGIDWSNRMNDVARGQISRRGDYCFTRRQSLRILRAPNLFTLAQNLWSTRVVNRAVNTAAAEQRRIRRVHHCAHILTSDVADDDTHTSIQKRLRVIFILHYVAQS